MLTKLGGIVFVLCQLFLLASSQDAVEVSALGEVNEVPEEMKGLEVIIVNPFNLSGPPPQLPKNRAINASGGNCLQVPEDPDYSGLIAATLGLIPEVGGVANWLYQASLLGQKASMSSKFYSCDTEDKLQQQLDRVLAQAQRAIYQDNARNAKIYAEQFFDEVATYDGEGYSLADQSFSTISDVATFGKVAYTEAKVADILGAEIMAEVAIFLASVQLIQIGKAESMGDCNPVVNQLVHSTIGGTIEHLESVYEKNLASKSDFNCALTKTFGYIGSRQCDGGEFSCHSDGTIVYDLIAVTKSGRHNQVCTGWEQVCNPPYCPYSRSYCPPPSCTSLCKEYVCPYWVVGDMEKRARDIIGKEFDEYNYLWWNGTEDPNDKGVLFYLDELKKMRHTWTHENARQQCMRGSTGAPVPAPSCMSSGEKCGNSSPSGVTNNCSDCCSKEEHRKECGRYACTYYCK